MKSTLKRITAIILVIMMIFSLCSSVSMTAFADESMVNCASGKSVTFEYGSQVTANASWGVSVVNSGLSVLTDGVNSTTTYAVNNGNVLIGLKQDYIKGPYSFIVDLGGLYDVDKIASYFYDRSNWSVVTPEKVEYYVSKDKTQWTLAGEMTSDEAETTVLTDSKYPNDQSPSICKLQLSKQIEQIRYVKMTFDGHTDSSIAIALAEFEVYGDESDILDLGGSFDAFVYNITSWKLLSSVDGNATINKRYTSEQLLKFEKNSDFSYYIYTEKGKYLTATDDSNATFEDKTGADNQKWYIQGEDGFYKFKSVCSENSYLEVADNSRENGANVQVNTASAGNEQYFQIIEGTYKKNGYDRGYLGGAAGDGVIYAKGIDVSKWNEKDGDYSDVDFSFKLAKASGIDYAIIRAGSTNSGLDPMFNKYYTAAKAAGLDVGAYFYTYAKDTAGARADAEKCLSYIKGKTFEYPIYFDYEDPSQNDLSKEVSKSINMTFMTIMANEGYLSGMYTGLYKSTTILFDDICETYDSWIAHYYDKNYIAWPEYSNTYGMWQYTDSHTVEGITGVMDINVCYKDYPTIVKQYGFNGYSTGEWTDLNEYVYEDGTYASGWTKIGADWHYFGDLGEKNGEFSLDKNALKVETGATDTIQALYYDPSKFAEEETEPVVWASSNEKIVTVDQNGNVTAISAGLADITATWKGMTVTCAIEIADPIYKDHIMLKTMPTKTTYACGDEFDSTGMQVRLYYTNNAYEVITDYEILDFDTTTSGTKTVTVAYEDFTTTFEITVLPENVVRIYGDVNFDLATLDNITYTGVIDLFAGEYNFNVKEYGTPMGCEYTFENAVANLEYSEEIESATTLKSTGGFYKFTYNVETNKLTVEYSEDAIEDTASKYFPICDASYTSLNSALASLGIDSSKENRMKIAIANGMTDYAYTGDQNTALLNLLKQGLLINPDYTAIVLGDINSDGEISITDATFIQKILCHLETNSYKAIRYGDVDGNGKLTIRDVTYIQMFVAQYIEKFPVS